MHQQAQALSPAKLQVLPLILQLFPKQLNPLQRLQVQLSLKQFQQDQKYLLLKQELQLSETASMENARYEDISENRLKTDVSSFNNDENTEIQDEES